MIAPELGDECGEVCLVIGRVALEVDARVVDEVVGHAWRRPHARRQRRHVEEVDHVVLIEVARAGCRGRLAIRVDLPDAPAVR